MLSSHSRVALAFSGGVDSTFLAWFIKELRMEAFLSFLVVSPFLSGREYQHALRVACEMGVTPEIIDLDALSLPAVRENPVERCYHCKREVMARIRARAQESGCSVLLDGSNVDDQQGHRPGRRALEELGILSPLASAGMRKADIRALSRFVGLSTWDKPSQSCLATRVPYGTPLTRELLSRIEEAEAFLWGLGCQEVRVRYHGDLARLEVDQKAFGTLMEEAARDRIVREFHRLGFLHVSLDLAGFRSGSWDEALQIQR